ncbi:MAG: asparagine--tRNA ligase [Chloroherpetonaceae bacterium]|nr:asparagine--tRNA ligase [Chloroherpetonaceae bacterium]MDW8437834.1 asparagine--tRNA ligase [Chloroherpetonaceae bacterium]
MSAKHVYISHLNECVGETVTIKGWLYNIRSSGKLMFPELRDGTGIVQGVVSKKDVSEKVWEDFGKLTQESSIIVTGTVAKHPKQEGVCELHVSDLQIVQIAEEYPITPKEHGIEFLADRRHLWLRSKRQWAIMRIRHEVINAIRDFFNARDFTLVDSPIITPNAAEGTTTLFELDYFDLGKAYLTQSGQLYGEASAMAFGKIYVFGPVFRAEKSKTRRHLTEFWMVEPEMAYYDLEMNMDLAEEFVEYIVQRALERRKEELKILERDTSKLEKITRPFHRLSYDEAVKWLNENGVKLIKKNADGTETQIDFPWGEDFGAPQEEAIMKRFEKPCIIHHYPTEVKAFYMKRDPQNPKVVLAMDMLAPEGYGEIIGGSQREDNLELLLERIRREKLPEDVFQWFLDLRRYGSVPHSGFGLGLERTVAWICGTEHIRETIPYPRMIYRNTP